MVPGQCACCGAAAATSRVAESADRSRSLIIPYCDGCLRHATARTTRNLAAALGSCLLALTLSLSLPMVWARAPLGLELVVVVLASGLPVLWRLGWPRRARPGHTAIESAVWWLSDGSVGCTHREFARALAAANSGEVSLLASGPPRLTPWLAAGPIVALIASPAGWYLHHPSVRIVNLSDVAIVVRLDDHAVVKVEPSSTENPAAGVEVRLPSGEHELVAQAPDGTVLSRERVRLESGARHLWAPESSGVCFWLEETRYGRADDRGPARIEALGGAQRFWVLPRRVDSWFAPNPPPTTADSRSTGGVLTALRQARCEQAPAQARPR